MVSNQGPRLNGLNRPPSVRDKCWQRRFVADRGLFPQPWFATVDGDRVGATDLSDALLARPGTYFLKPQFGSNGVAVVRVVSDGTRLTAASDCPDTTLFLDEFPTDPARRGQDMVAAAATQRHRYVDHATAGLPGWAMSLSILEGEIRPDRAAGSLFEPRVVAQRADGGRFVTLGAICKVIDTPIAATVARDFRELPLADALVLFLTPRVPPSALAAAVRDAANTVQMAGTRAADAIAPLLAGHGTRVNQFGVDGRLCWDAGSNRIEFWFLEFQFGIGRTDVPLPGYRPPADLRREFGPETG